jgi:hypothetical protein
MQLWSNNFDINHLVDYHVVDIYLTNQVYHYESRITTEWLQRASVTHIRGYHEDSSQFKPCKGIKLTTRHTRARRAPQVATVHNVVKELGRVLPRPSTVFHTYASADTLWVARTLSHYTSVKWGKVSSNSSTHEATQFTGPHKILYALVHNSNLLIEARRSVLNRHRRGLPPWSSEYQSRPLPFLPIQHSSFSPNCPARSHFKPFYHLFKFSTFQYRTRV